MDHYPQGAELDDLDGASDTASTRGILKPPSTHLSNSLIELLPNEDDDALSDAEDNIPGQVLLPNKTSQILL